MFIGNSAGCCTAPSRPIQLISFTIGSSGALTVANQANLPNQSDTLNGLLLDTSGKNLYASSMQVMIEGTISSFLVDQGSGDMSMLAPDPTNTIMPGRMSLHPNGKYLYASIQLRHHYPDQGGFDLFLRDPATGALTDTQRQFPGSNVGSDFYEDSALAVGGQYLLAVSQDSHKITVWSVDPATGNLTIASELNGNFVGLATDNTGTFALASLSDGTVNSYQVSAIGSLTQAGTAMATAGINNIVTDASNKFVYVENTTTSQIFGFSFDASSGALGSVPGSPFATSAVPIRMATVGPTQ